MADLLGDNLKAPEVELQTYLDSRLLVSSSKKQIQEITDIIWSLLLELHPLVQTNCSRNFVFILIKEKWILSFLVLLVVFFLGFDPLAVLLRSATQNMPSAALHPAVIDQYLFTELQKGHVAGPYAISPIPNLHSLDFSTPEYVMLWVACCLGFFRFLRAGEFTKNGPFYPSVHLTVADLQVDSSTNP
ncbi:unnamed protein product [Pocillopora meandrina]|uniref:Uncharacterized protein n=1 Tax=Pocillopora meandrina TaxID=46732 RepID=A0AAU9WZS5_9CNID|nr:unnamed protein product [Pocillopora meandrina]